MTGLKEVDTDEVAFLCEPLFESLLHNLLCEQEAAGQQRSRTQQTLCGVNHTLIGNVAYNGHYPCDTGCGPGPCSCAECHASLNFTFTAFPKSWSRLLAELPSVLPRHITYLGKQPCHRYAWQPPAKQSMALQSPVSNCVHILENSMLQCHPRSLQVPLSDRLCILGILSGVV